MVHLLLPSLGNLQQHQDMGVTVFMGIAVSIQLTVVSGCLCDFIFVQIWMKLVINQLHSDMSPSWPILFHSIVFCSISLFLPKETLSSGRERRLCRMMNCVGNFSWHLRLLLKCASPLGNKRVADWGGGGFSSGHSAVVTEERDTKTRYHKGRLTLCVCVMCSVYLHARAMNVTEPM